MSSTIAPGSSSRLQPNARIESLEAAGNAILRSLSREQWAHWEPLFHEVAHSPGATVLSPGEHPQSVWFPTAGVYCQTIETREGSCVDVAVIGREGAVGLPALFGIASAGEFKAFAKGASALRIDVHDLRDHSRDEPALYERVMLYSGVRLAEMTQIAACNRIHRLEQRLCRWLLTFCSRAQTSTVRVTHELIAFMLGTRRASVSAQIQMLEKRGALRHSRGELVVDDVRTLLPFACECYETIETLYHAAHGLGEDL